MVSPYVVYPETQQLFTCRAAPSPRRKGIVFQPSIFREPRHFSSCRHCRLGHSVPGTMRRNSAHISQHAVSMIGWIHSIEESWLKFGILPYQKTQDKTQWHVIKRGNHHIPPHTTTWIILSNSWAYRYASGGGAFLDANRESYTLNYFKRVLNSRRTCSWTSCNIWRFW